MSLRELLVPTASARAGMRVGELFAECIRARVPGLPFCDASGAIVGKASIRYVLRMNCMPDYLVENSHLLGDSIENVRFPEEHCHEVMQALVDDFVLPEFASIGVDAPVSKALARMEQHDTTYAFVRDNGHYLGMVTIISLAEYLYTRACGE
jgi:hypothetical protein